ncbi:hypothetical protein WG66_006741 [Moniliophthora roreri]|nr:hypothetical protein WG66_006741 [Moniliophthora roreri]
MLICIGHELLVCFSDSSNHGLTCTLEAHFSFSPATPIAHIYRAQPNGTILTK